MKSLLNNAKILLAVFIIAFAIVDISCSSESKKNNTLWSVKRIVDGDTFVVQDGSKKGLKIRLIGVNCPETKHPRKPVEYFGKEATQYMKKLIADKEVKLEYDIERKDRYGRTLAYVYLKNGTFVNAKLVEEGYAQVATYPPNVKHTAMFVKLQRHARENNKGLWSKKAE